MSENHQDKAGSRLIATENRQWVFKKKNKLWVPKHKRLTGFEDKTLWDKLILFGTLSIPLVVTLATIVFGLLQVSLANSQHQRDLELATYQHKQDQNSVVDAQREAELQTYFDHMTDLLLNHNLRSSKPGDAVRNVAHIRTLSTLNELDDRRRGLLVRFLFEAELINKPNPIIDLLRADITGADLFKANLKGAALIHTSLEASEFFNADLSSADLRGALLYNCDFQDAILIGTNLSDTDLSGTNLIGANLTDADLSGANLSGAKVTQGQLSKAKSLKGATMPDGSIHP